MATLDRAWLPTLPSGPVGAWRHRLASSADQVPDGFPARIGADMAWTGSVWQDKPETYRLRLSVDHLTEVETASDAFRARGLPIEQLAPETFPLPTLGPILMRLAKEIGEGRGFFALCGVQPWRYSKISNIITYVGIASYVGGRFGRQDEHGNMLLHLTDLGSAAAPDNERQAPYSSVGQPFHTDTGSILGLYALGKAAHGGESKLASSWYIYNELARRRPDLVRALTDSDWVFDTFGQHPAYKTRPLVHVEDGKVIFSFSRRPLLGSATSPRSTGIPDLSDKQVEALNMVQALAEEHALVFDLEAGDMLFWNNLGILHARNGFTDSVDHRRHLVRIWLHNDRLKWKTPRAIRTVWEDAFEHGTRELIWPVEPISDFSYVTTQQRSSGHG